MNLTMLPIMPLPKRGDPRAPHDPRPVCSSTPKAWDHTIGQGSSWRVKADVTIPALTTAGPYPSELLLGMNTTDNPKADKTVEVTVKGTMLSAVPGSDVPCHWLLCVTPARDRHEQNLEAIRDARGIIFFRAIKEIRRGDELRVWYSAELAMECAIPILTPGNIRSDQEYACTGCDVTFRYPNTLKAHTRFHCTRNPMTSWLGQYQQSIRPGATSLLSAYQQELSKYFSHLGTLWNLQRMTSGDHNAPRISQLNDISPVSMQESKSAFRPCNNTSSKGLSPVFTPTQSPLSNRSKMPDKSSSDRRHVFDTHKKPPGDDLSLRTEEKVTLPGFGPVPGTTSYLDKVYMYNYANFLRSDFSGFHGDITRTLQRMPPFGAAIDYPATSTHETLVRGRSMGNPGLRLPDVITQREDNRSPDSERDTSPKIQMPAINFPLPSETAGEPIDLLPKSLYMSKAYKGHLCIYCGKLYSRKYGLKIHLRTHTGYKPLKCKVCLRPFGDPSNLNKHIRLHAEGETPYRCEYCGKVLVRRRDLERHIKSRHPNHTLDLLTDDKSDVLCDTDTSFIDVDDDAEDDDLDAPLDMSRQDLEVS